MGKLGEGRIEIRWIEEGGKGGEGRKRREWWGRGKSRSRWGGKYEVYLPDFTPGGRDNGRKSKGQRRIMGIRKVMNGRRGRGAV